MTGGATCRLSCRYATSILTCPLVQCFPSSSNSMGIRIIAEAYALSPITLMSIDFELQHVGVWARTSVDGECGTRSNLDSESAARSRVDSEEAWACCGRAHDGVWVCGLLMISPSFPYPLSTQDHDDCVCVFTGASRPSLFKLETPCSSSLV